jgi:serine/threonine-protein kinase
MRLQAGLAERYTIERELGRGGMATVYLARDRKHDRAVALKVLKPDLAAAIGPDRFLREIRLTAQLDHPHILPLLDSGEAEGVLYYAMPYVEGETLRDRLARYDDRPLHIVAQGTQPSTAWPSIVRVGPDLTDPLFLTDGENAFRPQWR